MLTLNQIKEIREHLESSQNPLFFFDNDLDGLCSFLLLRRFLKRGKGVAIKSFPDLNETYVRKINELNPDKIFILDKPLVSEGFIDYCKQNGLEVVWIDHHEPQNPKEVSYYNPMNKKKPSNEPVSYLCWQVVKRDEWIALLGCLYDWYLPDFVEKFSDKYPGLLNKGVSVEKARFDSDMGKLMMILIFAMKDSTTNVVRMIRLLNEAETPYEILSGEKKYEYIMRRYKQLNRTFSKLLNKALGEKHGKITFFQYSGEMSVSRELCNELFYRNPEKIVMVAFVKGEKVNISMTSGKKDLRLIVAAALKEVEGTGGGHAAACGASIQLNDLKKFKEIIESYA
ncbi:DHH family phosphoesterase [Nanoarchaeota archaeon]